MLPKLARKVTKLGIVPTAYIFFLILWGLIWGVKYRSRDSVLSVTYNVIRFQQPLCGRQQIFLVRKTVAETEIRNAQKRCRVNDTKERKKKTNKKQNLFLSVRKCKPELGG
jgi:hypothetical protein